VPGLVSRVGVTVIPMQCTLLQPSRQEQGSKMVTRSSRPLSHTWRACNKNSSLTGIKELYDKCNIMFDNNHPVKGDYVEK